MFTQLITFAIIVAIIGCIMYGRKLIRTEKVDAVFGNPERAKGGTHWIIVGSSVILLTWLYYSWDIAKSFYPQSANELCQVGKVNDSLLSLKYLFPIEERGFKSTSIIKSENKNIIKLKNEIQNLKNLKVIITLGKIAFDNCIKFYKKNFMFSQKLIFKHGVKYKLPDGKILIPSYHPSPRNVNTKVIDSKKMIQLLKVVKKML